MYSSTFLYIYNNKYVRADIVNMTVAIKSKNFLTFHNIIHL